MYSWSSGNAFIAGAGGLKFISWAGQIVHGVANVSPPLRHFFERSYDTEIGLANSLHASACYSFGQEFEEIHRNIGSLETPKQMRIPPTT